VTRLSLREGIGVASISEVVVRVTPGISRRVAISSPKWSLSRATIQQIRSEGPVVIQASITSGTVTSASPTQVDLGPEPGYDAGGEQAVEVCLRCIACHAHLARQGQHAGPRGGP
jgi:hypothetical protein